MHHDDRIAETLTRLLFAIDRLDWEGVRATLATRLRINYTSLFGGEPEELAAAELISRWRSLLPGFDATQHITGPVVVTHTSPERVTAETHVRGYHYINASPGGTWMVAGHYVMTLRREHDVWRIHSITLELIQQEGKLDLPQLAAARASAGEGRAHGLGETQE
jgi:hypothetical protein